MDWSYVAGFFDGEGYVSLNHWGRNGKLYPILSITNTSDRVLVGISGFLEGSGVRTHLRHKNRHTVNGLKVYELTVSDKVSLQNFIYGVHPHLIVKVLQVEKCMEQLENNMSWNEYVEHRKQPIPTSVDT